MRVLVTGGAGYIGSHTTLALLASGYEVVILDNLCNASLKALARTEELAGRKIPFVKADLCDAKAVDEAFSKYGPFDAVIHFAALKAVGESVAQPLRYYDNNINGSIELAKAMKKHGVKRIVFSSSATVYGDPLKVPVTEDESIKATNPYGHTKAMMEQILADTARAEKWHLASLRYFNPVGAHKSGRIGEDPVGTPNNLVPFVAQVAVGMREKVTIFGGDWPTPDGTGVRDYIHVLDLADAHVAALKAIWEAPCVINPNVGSGRGYSVKEVVETFRQVSGKDIPYVVGPRRPGDVANVVGNPAYAESVLKWKAKYDLKDMIADSWRWQEQNPKGYRE
jgi:UDP-glucose 4-epimerase